MTNNRELVALAEPEVLSLGYTEPPIGCTKERWHELLKPFAPNARYHAANLAAHNWDVLFADGRAFLFQTRYGGDKGHWLNPDGSREDATDRQHLSFYTKSRHRKFTRSKATTPTSEGV